MSYTHPFAPVTNEEDTYIKFSVIAVYVRHDERQKYCLICNSNH